MEFELGGKSALITGASQGIGEAVAYALADQGVNLHLTARNEKNLQRVRQKILSESDVRVEIHPLDLTEQDAIVKLTDSIGEIEILINNAGAIPGGDLSHVDEFTWRRGWELKVMGYIDLCRATYPKMKANGGGVIINNIGNAGEVFDAQYIAGTSGNASLMAFTRALGGRSLDDNIRVIGINPGPVDTERIYALLKNRAQTELGDKNRYKELLERYPLGRPAYLREVTDLIVFLASFRAGYISGTIITVDGGISSRSSII
ncbi:MAG: SDR family oxidoreductase [Gammaproteobacteria bacterium]|nr:SDR family oxidoreductase [Gammaproteobacteria bacterium]